MILSIFRVNMKKFCLCIGVFVLCFTLKAQHTRFKTLGANDGLFASLIYALAQDSTGYIWLGGDGGVCRYDGNKYTYFVNNPLDTNSFYPGIVRSILCDINGYTWVGGSGTGLVRINQKNLSFDKLSHDDTTKTDKLPSYSINSLTYYGQKIYIATFDIGLWTYDVPTGKFENFSKKYSLPKVPIRNIQFASDGTAWIATRGEGVLRLNLQTGNIKSYNESNTHGKNIVYNRVDNLYIDHDGWIWLSLWSSGNAVMRKGDTAFISDFESDIKLQSIKTFGLVFQFKQDREGNIWLCSAEAGAVKYNKKTGKTIAYRNSLHDNESIGDNTIFCMLEDHDGLLWFGSWKAGVHSCNPSISRFGHYKPDKDNSSTIHNSTVTSIAVLNADTLLIGTGNGIATFDLRNNQFSRYDFDKKQETYILGNATVKSMFVDDNKRVWVGVDGSAIHLFKDGKRVKRYTEQDGLFSAFQTQFLQTKDKHIFVGTTYGLYRFNELEENFTGFIHSAEDTAGISSNRINFIAENKQGNIWIATDMGLNLFQPKFLTFKKFFHRKENTNSIPHNDVRALYYSQHILWIGTAAGLCSYNEEKGTFTSYTHLHEYLQTCIFSIVEDEKANLWMTSARGLLKFNYLNGSIELYTRHSGLQGNEFPPNSHIKLPDGRMAIGGMNGFNLFYPGDIFPVPNYAKTIINDIRITSKPLAFEDDYSSLQQLHLSYKDYFFTISFSALSFQNPEKNIYAYKLVGFNEDWVNTGTQTSITFTNLNPGNYILQLKSANSLGVWSDEITELKISISPPFWKTWWFYTLSFTTILSLIYVAIRFREKKLKLENEKLEQKVTERTQELTIEKLKLQAANKDIRDSINYAKRIQNTILPSAEKFTDTFNDFFVLFKPKDIVSGDFYWMEKTPTSIFLAAADCTGHGVPGAMVSVVCANALTKSVLEENLSDTGKILDRTRELVIEQFSKSSEDVKDGMDISIVTLSKQTLQWSGANNPLWIIRKGATVVEEFKPDKQPIGKTENPTPFKSHTIHLSEGDTFYLITDGFQDQFGGERGKKLKAANLKKLLLNMQDKTMPEQKLLIETFFDTWKGVLEQIDDVCILGIRITPYPAC